MFQKLGIGYFLLGFAPAFVVVDPQSIGPLVLTMGAGLVTGAVAFAAFLLITGRLMDAVAGVDVDEAEPTGLAYYSTFLLIGVGALALLPVILWVMVTVAPAEELAGDGGRRSPLWGALVVSAALVSVVAEPLWHRVLQFTPVDAVR